MGQAPSGIELDSLKITDPINSPLLTVIKRHAPAGDKLQRGLAQLFSFVLIALVSPVEVTERYSKLILLLTLAHSLSSLGLDAVMTRVLKTSLNKLRDVISIWIAKLIISFLIAFLIYYLLGLKIEAQEIFFGLACLFYTTASSLEYYINIYGRYYKVAAANIIIVGLSSIIKLFLFFLGNVEYAQILALQTIEFLLVLTIYFIHIGPAKLWLSVSTGFLVDVTKIVRKHWRLWAAAIFTALSAKIDQLMIADYLAAPDWVLYVFILKFNEVMLTLNSAYLFSESPHLYQAVSRRASYNHIRLYRTYSLILFFIPAIYGFSISSDLDILEKISISLQSSGVSWLTCVSFSAFVFFSMISQYHGAIYGHRGDTSAYFMRTISTLGLTVVIVFFAREGGVATIIGSLVWVSLYSAIIFESFSKSRRKYFINRIYNRSI